LGKALYEGGSPTTGNLEAESYEVQVRCWIIVAKEGTASRSCPCILVGPTLGEISSPYARCAHYYRVFIIDETDKRSNQTRHRPTSETQPCRACAPAAPRL